MKQATCFAVQPGWKLLLSDLGLNVTQILRLAGLPGDLFTGSNMTVTPKQYFQLWSAIEHIAGDTELPLSIGRAISAEAFDPPIFASLCSKNLNCALQRLSEFKRLIGPMALDVSINAKHTVVTLECYGNEGALPQSIATTELVFLTQLSRLGTRHRLVPSEVVLPEPPTNEKPYADFFGVAPTKGKVTRISFSAQESVRPFLTENPMMLQFFDTDLRQRLSDLDASATISARVKSILLEILPAGERSVVAVADRLALSKRTLQRQLSEESANFQDILNTTRLELAYHYLSRSEVSPGEISFLLGFQDSNSFIRAFKNWSGMTPSAYRKQTLNIVE